MPTRTRMWRFIHWGALSLWALFLPAATWGDEAALLEVAQSDMQFTPIQSGDVVIVVGKLRSLSSSVIEEVVVEAQFFNDQGALIDTAAETLYASKVPAHGEAAFKIETRATQPRDRYAKHQVLVLAANEVKPCVSTTKKTPVWLTTLISWTPMLLLIAAWLLLTRKYNAKGSPQHRSLELIGQQNALLAKQVDQLQRLADAAQRWHKPDTDNESGR